MINIGVLISGGGSNLQSVIDNIKSGYINARIAVVISDNKNAYGLIRASEVEIDTETVDFPSFDHRSDYDAHIVAILKRYDVELVVLAGYMKVVTPVFIDAYKNKILNIHPALLPSFPGLHVQKKTLEYGAKFSGCTVHFVDEGVDTGPIIAQAVVPVLDDDTEESLSSRILKQEHKLYPLAIRLYTQNRLTIEGRRVMVSPPISHDERINIAPPHSSG